MSYILVVDDNEQNLYYLEMLLQGHGHTVQKARNGKQALELSAAQAPSMIVSDLLMPEMDGYSLLRQWRADPDLCSIPFVVYTGTYTEREDEALALDMGADVFLRKPCEPEELIRRLQKVLEQPPTHRPTLEPGDQFLLEQHNQILVRKLSERNRQLQRQNRQLLEEFARRERLMRNQDALLNALPARIALLDHQGTIQAVNQNWLDFGSQGGLTWSEGGMGQSYFAVAEDAYLEGAEETVAEGIRAVIAGRIPSFSGDYPCHTSSERKWFRMLVAPLRSPSQGAVVMHLDISRQKDLELQLLRAQRLESIGTMASGMAHDLNNMLLPILMSTELLKPNLVQSEDLELIETIERSAQRGADLVKQVLLFARGVEAEKKPVDLTLLLREALRILQDTFPKEINLQYTSELDSCPLLADATQLHQVIVNLCLNARDAMAGQGELSLRLTSKAPIRDPDGHYGCLEVQDHGQGMPPEVLEKIFDPFFTTKPVGQGTGLGMSTSLAIVENHGGCLEVASQPGCGTTVRVYLPLRKLKPSKAPEPTPIPSSSPSPKLVLVVDDEPSIRLLTARLLQSWGYRVLEAGDGAEALRLFEAHSQEVSLILSDASMPVMGGLSLTRELRSRGAQVPIVLTSGYHLEGDESSAENGPDAALPKPFSAQELRTVLNDLLQQA